ncbi:MAG: general secretion pathway protein GspK [Alphaproteobacteria bacterium]|nr:general secretion pathway protein GspK [Alphaproteobacteria bacterium]
MTQKAGQRGIALIAVLWALVLLALIAATVLGESRGTSRLARNLLDAARAEALADGGVHRAVSGLAAPVAAGSWRADGTVYAWRRAEGEIRIRIEDEGGKVDLNRAGGLLLRRLFEGVGLEPARAEALADAVEDYRDADGIRRQRGAEDPDYQAAGLPFGAKDAPFDAVEELQQVLGMNAEIYAALAGAVTVHSRVRRPDPRAAPPLVRAALGNGDQTPPAPPADEPQEGPAGAGPPVAILSLGPTAHRSRVRTYTIHAEARTASGGLFARRAVVRMIGRGPVPYRIVAWGRGETRLFAVSPP